MTGPCDWKLWLWAVIICCRVHLGFILLWSLPIIDSVIVIRSSKVWMYEMRVCMKLLCLIRTWRLLSISLLRIWQPSIATPLAWASLLFNAYIYRGGSKVSTHTLALIAQSLSAELKLFFLVWLTTTTGSRNLSNRNIFVFFVFKWRFIFEFIWYFG